MRKHHGGVLHLPAPGRAGAAEQIKFAPQRAKCPPSIPDGGHCLHFSSALEGAQERHLVGILELAAHGDAVGQPRHLDAHGKTAHPSSNAHSIRYPYSQLRNGCPAAHRGHCLVLLGSPPDTVHSSPLRRTKSSTPLIWVRRHSTHPRLGIPPRCSGLRVTGHRYLPE